MNETVRFPAYIETEDDCFEDVRFRWILLKNSS